MGTYEMKYIVKLLPLTASYGPTPLEKWLNGLSAKGLELVTVDGHNYIFKEVPVYTK